MLELVNHWSRQLQLSGMPRPQLHWPCAHAPWEHGMAHSSRKVSLQPYKVTYENALRENERSRTLTTYHVLIAKGVDRSSVVTRWPTQNESYRRGNGQRTARRECSTDDIFVFRKRGGGSGLLARTYYYRVPVNSTTAQPDMVEDAPPLRVRLR